MIVLALLALVGFVSGELTVVLPEAEPTTWKAAHPEDYTCPPAGVWDPNIPHMITHVFTLKIDFSPVVQGFLCYQNVWESYCDETWYFSKTYRHKITVSPISVEACLREVREFSTRKSDPERYPDVTCAYSSTTKEEFRFVHLEPHDVNFDIYHSSFVDPLFPGGNCPLSSHCQTTRGNVMWLPADPSIAKGLSKVLLEDTTAAYTLTKTGSISEDSYIYGPSIPPSPLKGACKLTVVQTEGYLLQNGFWFSHLNSFGKIIFGQMEHSIDKERKPEVSFNFPNCDQTKRVALPSVHSGQEKLDSSYLHILAHISCMDAIRNIRKTLNITRLDIAKLAPTVPGLGKVFQLTQDGVRVGMTQYRIAEWSPRGGDHQLGLEIQTGKTIHWRSWETTEDGLKNGPNGIFIKDGSIVHPNLHHAAEIVETDLLLEHSLMTIPHPEVPLVKSSEDIESVTKGKHGKTLYLKPIFLTWWERLWSFFSTFGKIILAVSMFLLLILLFIALICACIRCCRSKKPKNKNF